MRKEKRKKKVHQQTRFKKSVGKEGLYLVWSSLRLRTFPPWSGLQKGKQFEKETSTFLLLPLTGSLGLLFPPLLLGMRGSHRTLLVDLDLLPLAASPIRSPCMLAWWGSFLSVASHTPFAATGGFKEGKKGAPPVRAVSDRWRALVWPGFVPVRSVLREDVLGFL